MSSSKITLFRRTVLPTHFFSRVRCLQLPGLMLRNSRPYLFHSSSSKNFKNIKNAETGHKTEAVCSNAPEKKLATSLKEQVQKKFTGISKKLNPDTPPSGKNIWNFIRDNWKQVLGAGILADFLFALAVNKISKYRVNSALKNGTRPKSKVLEEFVPRPQISEILKKIFQPNEHQSFYHVVCGEHGTGKTTLTRMEAKNVGK
ncbi:14477_t:CDS:1, partial [Funneliformis mosseae]